VLRRQAAEDGLVAAVAQPVADMAEAEALVEAPGRVPVEHLEIDAAPAALDRDGGEPRHQTAADPAAARVLADIQVLKVHAGAADPGRETRMEQRHSGRFIFNKGEDRLELRLLAEA